MGPRTLCNACGLVYAKLIKKRFNSKPSNPKKPVGGAAGKIAGGTTTSLGGGVGGQMHMIAPEDSQDEGSEDEEEDYRSQDRRSDLHD
ncbi:hypothetical protein NLJ89_g7214 [Agrocybe chaxingu]|uniref:GATA-type domain-containing protein n=1 Tax=Agrocybe chaxingu TaxID=84603 RepID=A0A9W8JXL7_9AGAR|nr:hypothetical protein NLJ89_g7214 [Agrocybe chaxingu]